MNYSAKEIMQYVDEEDVKFIRLAFCDVFGQQKNISIMPGELKRAFSDGIAIDASAIYGFGGEIHSDLFLVPDPSTITPLPWRPEHGRVIRLFCNIKHPDGKQFDADTRAILKKAVDMAEAKGYRFTFGSEIEFYLFKTDDEGNPTKEPYDNAGYMDIAPADKGENVRREICLTLEKMGIRPETSHHEVGPGQNEIDFKFSNPLKAADDAVTFCSVVRTVAARNGLYADFSPKPLKNKPGNGYHINISIENGEKSDLIPYMVTGILEKISDITLFLNSVESSYERLGNNKAPGYITWSAENRSQLIRIPAAEGDYRRAELRSPDPYANPYLAFALLIHACVYGLEKHELPPEAADINMYEADYDNIKKYKKLPATLSEALKTAIASDFVKAIIPDSIIRAYSEK